MRIPSRPVLVPVLVATLAAACGGCAKKNPVSFNSITSHPAPEMYATSDRWVDGEADYAYMRNTNYRSFWDDLARALLIDNPSRLSPYPTIDASGNPR